MTLLPLPHAHRIDPLARLEQRSRRMAQAVEACSPRRDVRRTRAQLVLLILELSCPRAVRPRLPWYVPGACTRVGAEGLRRAWRPFFDEDPRSSRTVYKHLAALENACVLVRGPGDWIPIMHPRPEVRPRFADSFHLVDTDLEAQWWASEGARLLRENPRARTNPDAWARLFGRWHDAAAAGAVPDLFEQAERERVEGSRGKGEPRAIGELLGAVEARKWSPSEESRPVGLAELLDVAAAVRARASPYELLAHLRAAGAQVIGRMFGQLARGDPGRLYGAAALWALAAGRGDRMHNRAGWIVRAWQKASADEMAGAIERVDRRDLRRRARA